MVFAQNLFLQNRFVAGFVLGSQFIFRGGSTGSTPIAGAGPIPTTQFKHIAPAHAGGNFQLVADFGGFTAKDLELRSTIVYLWKPGQARAELVKRVHEVKPHFTENQTDSAIHELETKGYVGHFE
jgi:hypothetical protein